MFRVITNKVQCNSDANCSELSQISQLIAQFPTRLPSFQTHAASLEFPSTTCTSDQLDTNSGVPTTTSSSVILQNNSEYSGKLYLYNYSFLIKDTNQDQSKEKINRERFGRVLNVKLFCPQHPLLSQHIVCCHKPGLSL